MPKQKTRLFLRRPRRQEEEDDYILPDENAEYAPQNVTRKTDSGDIINQPAMEYLLPKRQKYQLPEEEGIEETRPHPETVINTPFRNTEKNRENPYQTLPEKNLHPLRRQYLQSHLEQISCADRTQSRQDSFTSAMYGKKDFSEEKEKIMKELQQGKQSILHSIKAPYIKGEELRQRLKRDHDLNKEFGYRNIPQAIQYAIDDYRKENPQKYQQEKEAQRQWDRDQALGKPFQTQSLEEWRKQDAQYTNKDVHCNTAMGSILKERGIDLPANTSMNDIIKYMKNSPEWKEIPMREGSAKEHQIANEWAKQGHTAVFGQLKEGDHGHGGVLTGNLAMSGSKNFLDEHGERIPVPEIEGSIGKNPITKKHLGWHLTSGKNASYFLYVGPEEKNNEQKEPKNE